MTKTQAIAKRLADLLIKHGGKLSQDGQTVSFPSPKAAENFNREWMA